MANYGTQSTKPFYAPRSVTEVYRRTKGVLRTVKYSEKINTIKEDKKSSPKNVALKIIEPSVFDRQQYLKKLAGMGMQNNYSLEEITKRLENAKG
jgi:hypothetical protein